MRVAVRRCLHSRHAAWPPTDKRLCNPAACSAHLSTSRRGLQQLRRVSARDQDVQGTAAVGTTTTTAAPELPTQKPDDVTCVGTGLDVKCVYDDDQVIPAHVAPQNALEQALEVALLVSPFFFWGTSMVVMKGVIPHTTPLFLGSLRLLPAGIALVAWAATNGRRQPATSAAWLWITAFAVVDGAAFQGFLAEGLQRTTAGLGSVIIDSQPLTVALLAALLFNERLSPAAILGLFVGVGGLSLLEVPPATLHSFAGPLAPLLADPTTAATTATTALLPPSPAPSPATGFGFGSGELLMLAAAQSMALGTIMVRWVTRHADPVMATGWHMVLGGLMLLAASLATEAPQLATNLTGFNAADAAAMAYVSLLGGAASYGIFFYNAAKGDLTALSSLTFLTPMFAAGAGYAFLGETLTPLQLTGAVVTLGAVFLINQKAEEGGA